MQASFDRILRGLEKEPFLMADRTRPNNKYGR